LESENYGKRDGYSTFKRKLTELSQEKVLAEEEEEHDDE
jgi:hypothetical protein